MEAIEIPLEKSYLFAPQAAPAPAPAPVAVSSLSQPTSGKHRKRLLLLCASLSVLAIILSSVAIGLILVSNSSRSAGQNPPAVESMAAATLGASAGEDAARGEESGPARLRSTKAPAPSPLQSEESSGASEARGEESGLATLRRTKAPAPSPVKSEASSGALVPLDESGNGFPPSRSPTYAPTSAPTDPPSSVPTDLPTSVPSELPTELPTAKAKDKPLTFYAIGDVPYSDVEACLLPYELAKLSATDGQFLVHLGDLQDGQARTCPKALHANVAHIFEASPVPALFVIGDNEWLDCDQYAGDDGMDAAASYASWQQHLGGFHERTDLDWAHPLAATVARHPDHPEFFAFVLDGVLFLGQGLPVPRPENMPPPRAWRAYLEANAEWTRGHFAEHAGRLRAAVIFSHSSGGPVEPYFEDLQRLAASYRRLPILLVEDNHWFEDETYPETPNLYRLALDDTVTPTSITVDTEIESRWIRDVFRYDRGCWCSDGHRPTHLPEYPAGHDCEGACDTNALCAGENLCGRNGATCAPEPV